MSYSQAKDLTNAVAIREEFHHKVKEMIPSSCFCEFMEGEKKRNKKEHFIIVPTLTDCAQTFDNEHKKDLNIDEFLKVINLSKEQINYVYNVTKTQSKSEIWINQRKGRITASNFKNVYSKANKTAITDEQPVEMISLLMGYESINQTWQMKHGINSEIHAVQKFKSVFKETHKNCVFNSPGMTIDENKPYLSATPDLEIECSCHGLGLVEIKCPASIIGKIPSTQNYEHIESREDGSLVLKHTSPYYYQIQGQMAITRRNFCYFFVFTFQGYVSILVNIDFDFWNIVSSQLCWFWKTYIAPELLTGNIKKKRQNIYRENELTFISSKAICVTVPDINSEIVTKTIEQDDLSFEVE